ncbi:MAG: ATP-grasp domain-containing protein [Bacteroidota bacterium]
MTKTAILIPDGESSFAKFVVLCLSSNKHIEINVLSKKPKAPIRRSRYIKSFTVYDRNAIESSPNHIPNTGSATLDELIRYHYYDETRSQQLLDQIIRQAHKTKSTIIVPVDDHILKILTAHLDKLKAAGLSFLLPEHTDFLVGVNKWKLSQFLFSKGVPHPFTKSIEGSVDDEVLKDLTFPVLIKPDDAGNGRGIRSFQTEQQLKSYFEHHKDQKDHYIVQPLIDGYDIDCSVLCKDGKVLAYTIQKGIVSSKEAFHAAIGIEFLHNDEVISVVRRMMGLLNWSGVAHIDLRYDTAAKEIKVIEINARYWGSILGSLKVGINFPELAIKLAKGESIPSLDYREERYFMGKSPIGKLLKRETHFRNTSLYYSMRDPGPVLSEFLDKLSRKIKHRFK